MVIIKVVEEGKLKTEFRERQKVLERVGEI